MTAAGKRLSELLRGLAAVDGAHDCRVRALALDSRAVEPGALFIALPGTRQDGRAFIADALARAAAAVIYDTRDFDPPPLPVSAFGIANLAEQVSAIADRFYGAPSRRLVVIGVTGTNGKTTCTQLLAQAINMDRLSAPTPPLPPGEGRGEGSVHRRPSRTSHPSSPSVLPQGAGSGPTRGGARRCAIIGTLGYGFPGSLHAGAHTTPDAVTLQRLLADFAGAGAAYTAMEVSSHALEQGRVRAVAFGAAVFTNLTRDHLDYHGDMERYAAAKARLFDCAGLAAAVVNCEDDHGRKLIALLSGRMRILTYGLSSGDVRARALDCAPDGLRLRAATPAGDVEIAAPLLGRFNAANLLAALATLLALGFDAADAARRLSNIAPVPGRVERFKGADDRPLVVVDYAHTPDALEQVLRALRPHVAGRLWCVFGCGGERDRGKRPQMGAIAERLADSVILTDDNPRHESGDAIVRDIAAGMRVQPRVIRERKAAITAALSEAGADDVVLIAGKGHEDYQHVGDARVPHSDRETVRALLGLAA